MLDPDQDFGRDSINTNILATDLGYETSSFGCQKILMKFSSHV
jgi:hypothetical protein